jgi:hypothetical protein
MLSEGSYAPLLVLSQGRSVAREAGVLCSLKASSLGSGLVQTSLLSLLPVASCL